MTWGRIGRTGERGSGMACEAGRMWGGGWFGGEKGISGGSRLVCLSTDEPAEQGGWRRREVGNDTDADKAAKMLNSR